MTRYRPITAHLVRGLCEQHGVEGVGVAVEGDQELPGGGGGVVMAQVDHVLRRNR